MTIQIQLIFLGLLDVCFQYLWSRAELPFCAFAQYFLLYVYCWGGKGESCLVINPYKAVHLWNGVYLVDYHLPRHGLNIPRRLSGPATTSQLAEATVRENNHHLLVPRLLWTWPWAHYLSALCPRELGVGEQMVAIWCQKGKNLCREKNVLQIPV